VFEETGFGFVDLATGMGSAALDLPKRKENIFVWKDGRKDGRMKSEGHSTTNPFSFFNFFNPNK
jgi:hypothetical protein